MIQTCNAVRNSTIKTSPSTTHEVLRVDFETLLPLIRQQAQMQFGQLRIEAREEAIAETISQAFVAYVGLVAQGKADRIAATPLAKFAARRVRSGRRVGTSANVNDVFSVQCQMRHKLTLKRLDHFHAASGGWADVLVEDPRTTPAEIAITRIDFRNWLAQLPARLREVAEVLATGETTSATSQLFGVSMGRISQIRVQLRDAWLAFQGEPPLASLDAA